MAHTLDPSQSAYFDDPWPAKSMVHANVDQADLRGKRPSFGKRVLRSLTIFCVGVVATLAWQSYGDAARGILANSYPQLGWLAPQSEAFAQTVPNMMAPVTPPSVDTQQFATMSLTLATLRQSVEQLVVEQQRMAGDVARLQAAEQEILTKISAPPPKPAAAPAPPRKPPPPAPQALAQPER
jgi:hypothetical protein